MIEDFKKYIVDNKANLNKDVLKNADINSMYNEYKTSWKIWQNYFNPAPVDTALEDKIKSGKFSWKDAYDYNKQVWSKTGARDLALTSKEWVQNLNTTVTADEAVMMNNAWISKVWEWVTADLQWWTVEDYRQNVEKITTKTPEWETIVTKETPKGATDFSKIQSVDEWKTQTGWWVNNLESWIESKYGTIATQNADWTISATIWDKKYQWKIDEAWNPIKNEVWQVTPDDIYTTLAMGWNVDKNTPWYDQALNRFNKNTYYKWLSDKQLTAELGKSLLPWTNEYNDLIKDPLQKARIDKIQQFNLVKWVKTDTNSIYEEKSDEILSNTNIDINGETMTLKTALEDWYITADEMTGLTNNSQIITKAQEVEKLKNQYDEELATYEAIAKDIKDQFKGTWATRRDIAVATANAQEKVLPWLLALESRLNNAVWTLTQMKADSTQLFATNLQLYKEQQAQADKLEERTYQEKLAQKQLEQQFNYEYWDINSTDPNVQRVAVERAVADMYNKYPIVWMESQATKVQKVQDRIAQGMTWAEAIASVEQEIRNSPAYKDLMAKQKAEMTPATTWTQDWSKLDDTTLYNSKTWETKKITAWTWIVWNVTVTAWTTNNRPDRNNNPWNVKIWDVWYWVDNQNHTIFWSVEDWYQAMVNDVNAKLTWWSKHSSKLTGQKLTPESTLADLWSIYAEDPKWANSVAKLSWYNTLTKLKDIDVNKLAPAIAKQEWFTWSIKAVDKTNEPLTDKEFTQSNQIITSFKTDPQVKAFEEAYSQWLNLLSSLADKSWPWDVAGIFQFMKTLDPQSVVRETEFEVAAKSAWVTEYLGNTWDRITEWKKLTDTQAEAFWKLAKQFILNKATIYDSKYQDGIKRLEKQKIDTSIFPNSIADEMRKQLEWNIQNQAISNDSSDDEIINYINNQKG